MTTTDNNTTPATIAVNKCPFGHGTVSVDPYPGYVHGRNRAICPNGCFAEDEKKTKREDF